MALPLTLICMLIYYLVVGGASSTGKNGGVILEEVLEAAPKWKVLRVSE